MAIDKYCYINLRALPPFFHNRFRLSYSKIELADSPADIEHPAIREGFKKYADGLALELHHLGELPAKSGIGSSSAFTVGMIHALKAIQGVSVTAKELAEESIAFENIALHEIVGSQDQITSSFGGINLINFGVGDRWSVAPIMLTPDYLNDFESRIVLMYSGIKRISSVFSKLISPQQVSEPSLMDRSEGLARRFYEILENEEDLDDVPEMLNESWQIKKALNRTTVTPSVEEFIEFGLQSGAKGGKALGTGGGGFFLFLTEPHLKAEFIRKMSPALAVPIKISAEGSTQIL